jgi:hypothetical protein
MLIYKILRDPIVHFLVAGGVLYALASLLRGESLTPADDKLITVDRDSLLTYMQYQSNVFDPGTFETALNNMDAAALQQLVDGYVREEVLFRESAALGLDRSDYIIRQRMVDKMRFLLGDVASADSVPTDAALQQWLDQNAELYRIAPSATFTHVFVDASGAEMQQAQQRAAALLRELNDNQVGWHDSAGQGDRFPFLRNYAERTLQFISGHFGNGFVQNLQLLQPDSARWQGPVESAYGYHLVLLTTLMPGREPALADVRTDLMRDLVQARSEERLAQLVETVRAQYQVDVAPLQSIGD